MTIGGEGGRWPSYGMINPCKWFMIIRRYVTLQCIHMKTILVMLQVANKQLSEAQVGCHHIVGGRI